DMAMAVVDLGSRRRTLLFLRADQLAHFVSCLVYLPRDRYTTAVRLEMQDILVRELGGVSIDYAARVSESPWAVVHFTVRLPEGRPFTVPRPDGLPVWIYQFKISPHPDIPTPPAGPDRAAMAQRFADAVTAIWHGRVEIDRFNELVLRAGLTWQQVALLRTY